MSEEMLAHLRTCEPCMNVAVQRDPDLLFRALGGEIEPPGGAEAFAAEVMHQIHVRKTERKVSRGLPALHRWALAAAATLLVVSGTMLWPRADRSVAPVLTTPVAVQSTTVLRVASRPVVERWDSPGAMIIEIPEEDTSDLKVVMIFDESLPVDL